MKQNDSRINAYKRAAGFQPQKITSDEAAKTNAEIEFLLKDKTEQAIQALAGGSAASAQSQTQSFTPFSFDKAPVYTSDTSNGDERAKAESAHADAGGNGSRNGNSGEQNGARDGRLLGGVSAEDKEKIESQFDFSRFAAQTGDNAFAPKKFSARPLDTLGVGNPTQNADTARGATNFTRPSPVESFALGLDDSAVKTPFTGSVNGESDSDSSRVPLSPFAAQNMNPKSAPWNTESKAENAAFVGDADAPKPQAVPWNGGKAELPWKEGGNQTVNNAAKPQAVPWNGGKTELPWKEGANPNATADAKPQAVPWNGGKTELPWNTGEQNVVKTENKSKKGIFDTLFAPREKQNANAAPLTPGTQPYATAASAAEQKSVVHGTDAPPTDSVFSLYDDEDEIQVFTGGADATADTGATGAGSDVDALPFKPQFAHELTSAGAKKGSAQTDTSYRGAQKGSDSRYAKNGALSSGQGDAYGSSQGTGNDSARTSYRGNTKGSVSNAEPYFTKMNDKPKARKNERASIVDTPPSVAEKMGKKSAMNVDVIEEVRRNQEKSRAVEKRREQSTTAAKRVKTGAPVSPGHGTPLQQPSFTQGVGVQYNQGVAPSPYPSDVLYKIPSKDNTRRRVAKFLLLIGTDAAAKVVAKLPQDQICAIIPEIASVKSVSEEEAETILNEFDFLYKQAAESGGVGTARTILEKSVGPERAEEILQKTVPFPNGKPFDYLKDLEAEQLSVLVEGESAPVRALVLSQVKPAYAAAVINAMNENDKKETVLRLSKLASLPPDILGRIDQAMREKVQKLQVPYHDAIDGRGALAEILRKMDSDSEKNILSGLHYYDEDLESDLRERLFTMDDIINADDRFMQNKLRDMDDGDIAVLICGKSPEFRKKILSNVSKGRASTILGDEDARKPFSRRESDAVTNEFFNALRRAWENGSLVINERDSEEWVQ